MSAAGPIDPEVLRRMRATITAAIATRGLPMAEAAVEARDLGRGLHPALPAAFIDAAVTELLREIGA